MKKILLLLPISLLMLTSIKAQEAPENIDIRLVVTSSTTIDVEINSNIVFPQTPVAAEFNLYLTFPTSLIGDPIIFNVSDNIPEGNMGLGGFGPYPDGKNYYSFTFDGPGFSLNRFGTGWERIMSLTITNVPNLSAFDIGDASSQLFDDFGLRTAINVRGFNELKPNASSTVGLPVELIDFQAKAMQDLKTELKWQTATELNNDRFEVEHSLDGVTFDRIGSIKGAGTTNLVQDYDFLHRNPSTGTNYYRLKQIDFDGTFEYSDIEAVSFDRGTTSGIASFTAYPNPAVNYVTIRNSGKVEKPWNADVIDVQGRIIKSFIMQNDTYQLDTSDLPAGVYHVRLKSDDRMEQLRFIKK